MVEELKCNVQGRDVKNCPRTDCIHHFDHIVYVIQPTDSVVGIAKRFGVDLRRLVELNPQVCTPGPQAGIEIMIPVDHLEIVPDVLQEIESEDPGVQEERIAGFKLRLPSGELYQFDKMVSVE